MGCAIWLERPLLLSEYIFTFWKRYIHINGQGRRRTRAPPPLTFKGPAPGPPIHCNLQWILRVRARIYCNFQYIWAWAFPWAAAGAFDKPTVPGRLAFRSPRRVRTDSVEHFSIHHLDLPFPALAAFPGPGPNPTVPGRFILAASCRAWAGLPTHFANHHLELPFSGPRCVPGAAPKSHRARQIGLPDTAARKSRLLGTFYTHHLDLHFPALAAFPGRAKTVPCQAD